MIYLPLNYNQINVLENSFIPSMVKSRNNRVYGFWERALFQRACSTIILNVPEKWNGAVKDFLYWCLFRYGYVSVFETDELGVVFNPCNLYGFDFFYQPTNCVIANPRLEKSLDLTIGKDTELLRLTPDYKGIWDIIGFFAEKLSTLDNALNLSIINNKFSYILSAKNKATAEALKKVMDKVNQGEPAVFVDKAIPDDATSKESPFQFWERDNLKNNYLTSMQLEDMQTLLNNFDSQIGIPTIPYKKKERMVTFEAESVVMDSTSRCQIWYDTLTNSIKNVNKMFPDLNLSVEMRYKESDGVEE